MQKRGDHLLKHIPVLEYRFKLRSFEFIFEGNDTTLYALHLFCSNNIQKSHFDRQNSYKVIRVDKYFIINELQMK